MDLRQLKVFIQVVETGSFTRAAEKLHIAQSAISVSVQKLELELGLTLFDRAERRPRLTAEGEVLFSRARKLVEEFQKTQQEMRELSGGASGTVRLGTSAMLGSYYLPEQIVAFRQRYPKINFQVVGEGTSRAQTQLIAGDIDMAMVNLVNLPAELEAFPLVTEPVVACVASSHPLAKRKTITFEQFAREPLALYGAGYYLRELVDQQCKQVQVKPNIVLETNILRLMTSLVIAKGAIGFVLERVVNEEAKLKAIRFDKPLTLSLGIAWRKDSYLSVANKRFADFLVAQMQGQRLES
ncbi:LysR family transcriptional regulator [Simiduia curdlanivorans]|uniref:LysR family transcriptional regulator n=1 Tax=Simiduia curdlanivorans TaxID=1492769 RepID=A0ABV8V5P0_9GAMM|nr:LysR family transcriptional regulator [Simiduia curdlanivorans]MDN3638587.1 LysR family transcriptional regulator [Simiduia curdlanivorans]